MRAANSQPYETISTQVLVIGAGAAGIRAALASSQAGAEVTIVSKGPVAESGSTFSSLSGGWGIQALVGDERTEENLENFYSDIIRAGLGVCDPKLARILVEESGPRLEDLLAYGLILKKDNERKYLRVKACFSELERAFLTEDMGNIRKTFQAMLRASRAKILIGSAAELIAQEGLCRGAWLVTPDQRVIMVTAGATVLATGGGAALFQDCLAGESEMGDGYALAYRAGAQLKHLEFIQFMLGLKGDGTRKFLPLSDLMSCGRIFDSEQSDILVKSAVTDEDRKKAVEERMKHHPFTTRDSSRLIDISVAETRAEGKRLFWSGNSGGLGLEVCHFSHAFNGGLLIDERGETTVPGLFAAGEVAAGPHGADRIGGCMMTATQVFGARAGRSAALWERQRGAEPHGDPPPVLLEDVRADHSEHSSLSPLSSARETFTREVMVVRNGIGLEECLRSIGEARTVVRSEKDMLSRLRGEHILTAMELVTKAALQRKESLGPHYRKDAHPLTVPGRR